MGGLLLFNRSLTLTDSSGQERSWLVFLRRQELLSLLFTEEHLGLCGICPFDSSSEVSLKPIKVLLSVGPYLSTGPRSYELLDASPILTK